MLPVKRKPQGPYSVRSNVGMVPTVRVHHQQLFLFPVAGGAPQSQSLKNQRGVLKVISDAYKTYSYNME